MSIQLQIDEMLDMLNWASSPKYFILKRKVENLADEIADEIADCIPELTRNGDVIFEGIGFAGTCAPFEPTKPGPVPEVLAYFDIEVEQWKDMCDETLSN